MQLQTFVTLNETKPTDSLRTEVGQCDCSNSFSLCKIIKLLFWLLSFQTEGTTLVK